MSPDRRSRILRTAFQSAVGAVIAVLVAVSNVVGEGKEVWAPMLAALLATGAAFAQNKLEARKDTTGVMEPAAN